MGKFMCKYADWDNLKFDIDEKVIPFLRSRGATKFGTIGTCFGGYPIIRYDFVTFCLYHFAYLSSESLSLKESMFIMQRLTN